jgi:hypothetical protein
MAKEAEITEVRVSYKLDATVTVNGTQWIKPGVEASIKFDGVPSPERLDAGSQYLISQVVEPILGQVIEMVLEESVKAELGVK